MSSKAAAREKVLRHFQLRYGVESLAEVRLTKVPGYWERIKPCGGLQGGCREPIHTFLSNEGPMRHTLSYFDSPRDERGRWASRTRTWQSCQDRDHENG